MPIVQCGSVPEIRAEAEESVGYNQRRPSHPGLHGGECLFLFANSHVLVQVALAPQGFELQSVMPEVSRVVAQLRKVLLGEESRTYENSYGAPEIVKPIATA